MTKVKKIRVKTIKPKSEIKDILTKMFEHCGITVIDVTNQDSELKKKKTII